MKWLTEEKQVIKKRVDHFPKRLEIVKYVEVGAWPARAEKFYGESNLEDNRLYHINIDEKALAHYPKDDDGFPQGWIFDILEEEAWGKALGGIAGVLKIWHVLEHLSYHNLVRLMTFLNAKVLYRGAVIDIRGPDSEYAWGQWLSGNLSLGELRVALVGADPEATEYMIHIHPLWEADLRYILIQEAKFVNVRRLKDDPGQIRMVATASLMEKIP